MVAAHVRASGYLDGLLDSHTAQTLASRAFAACERHAYGLGGRPRFKRRGDIASVQGKGPTSPLQWKDDRLVWGGKRRDRQLVLRPLFDREDKAGVQADALGGRIKYVRLVRRIIQGQARFFVQLICEGQPLQRWQPKEGVVGIDLGPSTAAIVGSDKAALVSFLPEIEDDLQARRRLQRAMDRSRRATNPQCFQADGSWPLSLAFSILSRRRPTSRTGSGNCGLSSLPLGLSLKYSKLSQQSRIRNTSFSRHQGLGLLVSSKRVPRPTICQNLVYE